MKRKILYLLTATISLALAACGGSDSGSSTTNVGTQEHYSVEADDVAPLDGNPADASYIVISKRTLTLKLYDKSNRLIYNFPASVGKKLGDKQQMGDMKTPEGEFKVARIQQSSHWDHDFGDGNGAVKGCFGPWFICIDVPNFQSVGIHGTLHPEQVGTRTTEGNITLRNEDLEALKSLTRVGMRVIIEPSTYDLRADGKDLEKSRPEPTQTEPVKEEPKQAYETTTATPTTSSPTTINNDNEEEVWHTVESGVLVSKIAARYGTTTAKIKELNPNINIDRISIGQRLKVKGKTSASTPQTKVEPVKSEKPATNSGEVYHTVQNGDLVSKIAAKYGTTTKRIKELNPNINIDRISIGQRIRVQ